MRSRSPFVPSIPGLVENWERVMQAAPLSNRSQDVPNFPPLSSYVGTSCRKPGALAVWVPNPGTDLKLSVVANGVSLGPSGRSAHVSIGRLAFVECPRPRFARLPCQVESMMVLRCVSVCVCVCACAPWLRNTVT